jgi:hypothetical protein
MRTGRDMTRASEDGAPPPALPARVGNNVALLAIVAELGGAFAETIARAARRPRNQDDAVEPWHARGRLGTHLAPNQNGRKW